MQNVYPVLKYDDAHAAIDFLERAFGFERLQVHEDDGGKVAHAELRCGEGVVALSSTGAGAPVYEQSAHRAVVYVVADEVDSLYERAQEAAAEIVMDPEGNIWSFGTYRLGG
jgi:uncharacterized glyoxalase superfamily protein PhnB